MIAYRIGVVLLLICTYCAGFNIACWRRGVPLSMTASLLAAITGLSSVITFTVFV